MSRHGLVLYGDFNCPWSYLAYLRAERLREAGLDVDLRAVEHDPWRPGRHDPTRFDCLRAEMPHLLRQLLPGEPYPYALAGFVPYTRAALSGYAEAYDAGVAVLARRRLFRAYWTNGVDLGDPKVVRTLLVDAVRSGTSNSELRRVWGYSVDVTGGPITGNAHSLLRQWRSEWSALGKEMVPALVVDDGLPLFGETALQWLADEIRARGVDLGSDPPEDTPPRQRRRDLPSLPWVTHEGNRWNRAYQDRYAV